MKKLGIIFAAIIIFSVSAAAMYWAMSHWVGASVKKETITTDTTPNKETTADVLPAPEKKTETADISAIGLLTYTLSESSESADGENWKQISRAPHQITQGNTFRSGSTLAEIYLTKGGIVRLDKDTSVRLGASADGSPTIELISGKIYARAPQSTQPLTITMTGSTISLDSAGAIVVENDTNQKMQAVSTLHKKPKVDGKILLPTAKVNGVEAPFSPTYSSIKQIGTENTTSSVPLTQQKIDADFFIQTNVKRDVIAGYTLDTFGAMKTLATKQRANTTQDTIKLQGIGTKDSNQVTIYWEQQRSADTTLAVRYATTLSDLKKDTTSGTAKTAPINADGPFYYQLTSEQNRQLYIQLCTLQGDTCTPASTTLLYAPALNTVTPLPTSSR